jgi:hypothetical protein
MPDAAPAVVDAAPAAVDAAPAAVDAAPVVCGPPTSSACGNPASVVRGSIRLLPGVAPAATAGQLVIALTHYREGDGAKGGVPHASVTIPGVDLAKGPVPFQLDMCTDSAMWSEDNCEYNLVAILDTNTNNDLLHLGPDPGEAATRIGGILLSCRGTSPCLDVVLDCTAGSSCTSFVDPSVCRCAMNGCMSDYAECSS